MRKAYFLIFGLLALAKVSVAQYVWNGSTSSDFQTAANWTPVRTVPAVGDVLSFDASSPVVVTNVPNQTISAVQITGGVNSVILTTNVSTNVLSLSAATPIIYSTAGSFLAGDFLTIQLSNSGTLFTIASGTFGIAPNTGGKISISDSLVLAGGKLDFDVAAAGGTIINAGGSITYISGIFSCITTAAITWAANSNYYHKVTGATASVIPAGLWQVGSKCNVTGMSGGSAAITGLNGIDFANFTWNCPTQSANVDLLPALSVWNITGTLTIASTGAGTQELRLSSLGKAIVKTGNFVQTGGTLTLQAAATADTTTLTVSNSFSQAAGNLNGVGGASPGTAIIDLQGSVTTVSGAAWKSTSSSTASQMNVQFSGAGTQNVSLSGTWGSPNAGRCNVINNNSDFVNGINLTGTLRVYNTGSSLPATFTMNGVITTSVSGAVTYLGAGTGGHTLIYSGSFIQYATNIEFPTTSGPLNLTVNNSLGVFFPTSPSFNRTIAGTLSLLTGNLAIGAGNTLSLTNTSLAGQLNYTTGFVTTGTLGRYFPATGLPVSAGTTSLFPFGAGTNDRSLNILFSSSALSGGTAGMVYVSHSPVVGVTSMISGTYPMGMPDNGVNLDKRVNTYWQVSTTGFALGATTVSILATGGNIGSVDTIKYLRLTDGTTPNLGTLISTTGTTSTPTVGKSALTNLNTLLYIGSNGTNVYNPLIIITYKWTGLGGNVDWTNAGNWDAPNTIGYPSASTEIAEITNTAAPFQPTIKTGTNVNVYQLTVGTGMTLTMQLSSGITVYDTAKFTGSAIFDAASTFGYASSNNDQPILTLPYGGLTISGVGKKYFPAAIKVTGAYNVSGYPPIIGTNTFTYAGSGAQRISAGNYYNLTITNPRLPGTPIISLGNNVSNNIIDVNNVFDVSGVSNFSVNPNFNTFNFSDTNVTNLGHSQPIPGFTYGKVTNSAGNRTLDPLGSSSTANVISVVSLSRPASATAGTYTVANSKVKFYPSGSPVTDYTYLGYNYHDMEISGNLGGKPLDFFSGTRVSIAGKFVLSATNFYQGTNVYDFNFNGTGDQTIPGFKVISAITPIWRYSNVFIAGGNRNVTLGNGSNDTIYITGKFLPETIAPGTVSSFSAGKGFTVIGSSVNFSGGPAIPSIPVLKPLLTGGNNYNNIIVSGGTRPLGGDMIIGGNLTVTGTDASTASLTIGNGGNPLPTPPPRLLTILGNILITGAGTGSQVTAQVDLNTGTAGTTKVSLAGNLSIAGNGQLMGTTSDNANNGLITFNGATPQTYSNTSTTYKNGLVNFVVGNGTAASSLTLISSLNMLASNGTTSPNKDSLTIMKNSSLDCGTFNIISNSAGTGNAVFRLQSGATLITANTGGIEGTATNGTNGSIISGSTIVKAYNDTASYTFNGVTSTPFPAAITKMANLTINANPVTLNQSIALSNTLTLQNSSTLALSASNLNLRSTAVATARIATVPNSANITYGTGRFVVERYFPARRAWRLITAPVTADAGRSVYNSWQMGGATTSNFGTFVTGPNADPVINGLDISPQNNFSLKVFNPATGLLTGVQDTRAQLLSNTAGVPNKPDNIGMFLFVRGDRSTAALFNPSFANTTTIRDTGRVQIHSQSFTLNAAANQWDLIGNPYASPVDITSIMSSATNINNLYFWAYDPYINAQDGGYVTMTLLGGVWVPTPANPAVTQDKNIQSSQAIYVQKNSSAPGSIVFDETNKSSQNNLAMFRPVSQPSIFRTNLYLQDSDTSHTLADGTLIAFDNEFSSAVDNGDAAKFGNTKETFYMVRDTKPLAVERRHTIEANDTIFFKLSKTTQRNYQFEFIPGNMNSMLTAFLEDSYAGTATPVSLTSNSNINFSVNADAKSAASDRFRIVFKIAGAGPLPVKYTSIKAYQKNKDIAVEWAVSDEINIVKYEVEKSNDGINFSKIGVVTAKGANGINAAYGFVDANPLQGNNFYRIANYNQTGSVEYSRIVMVKIGKTGTGISVYPNPVKGNMIGVSFNNMEQGLYGVRLISTVGQTLMNQQINHSAGSSMETLTPGSTLSTGIYQLEITAPDKKISTVKVIVQ